MLSGPFAGDTDLTTPAPLRGDPEREATPWRSAAAQPVFSNFLRKERASAAQRGSGFIKIGGNGFCVGAALVAARCATISARRVDRHKGRPYEYGGLKDRKST